MQRPTSSWPTVTPAALFWDRGTANCGNEAAAPSGSQSFQTGRLQRHGHKTQEKPVHCEHRTRADAFLYFRNVHGYSPRCRWVSVNGQIWMICRAKLPCAHTARLYVFGSGLAVASQGRVSSACEAGERLIWLQGSSWLWGWRSSSWLTFRAVHLIIKRSTFCIISRSRCGGGGVTRCTKTHIGVPTRSSPCCWDAANNLTAAT